MAHDENNEAHEGDIVQIVEYRPMSARKRWALHKIVERSK
jgi:small subunit ribosomal protein S17